jgi:XXXCH domain-containing protein
MMKDKTGGSLDPAVLAEALETLASQLRGGTLEVGSRQWSVPDTIDAKIRFKEKKGRIDIKIRSQWSTLTDYDEASRQEVRNWKDAFKTAKKRLARTFKTVKNSVADGQFPDDAVMEALIADSRAFAEFADDDWKPAMEEYLDHLENLRHAVQTNQLETAAHEVRDLQHRMVACHREFK